MWRELILWGAAAGIIALLVGPSVVDAFAKPRNFRFVEGKGWLPN